MLYTKSMTLLIKQIRCLKYHSVVYFIKKFIFYINKPLYFLECYM